MTRCRIVCLLGLLAIVGCQDCSVNGLLSGLGMPTTVNDVTNGQNLPPTGQPVPAIGGAVTVQVISRSRVAATVNIQYRIGDTIVHNAELIVPPFETEDLIGPDLATRIEITGQYSTGGQTPPSILDEGIGFSDGTAAVYYIPDPSTDVNDAPTIRVVEPAVDVTVVRGETLAIAWDDVDLDDNAMITAYLDPDSLALNGDETQIAPVFLEDPDGPGNDDAVVTIGTNVRPGVYTVLMSITDGRASSTARSAGRVTVERESGNEAPTMTILYPAVKTPIVVNGSIYVEWTDEDTDDNALIQFYLVPHDAAFDASTATAIGAPRDEDPDGPGDTATVFALGVPVGWYDLYAVISDATDSVVAKAPGSVDIFEPLPPPPPEPTCTAEPIVYEFGPTRVAFNDYVEINVYGENFVPGATYVQLVGPHVPTYDYTYNTLDEPVLTELTTLVPNEVTVGSEGTLLSFSLDLKGVRAGYYDLVVTTSGCPSAVVPDGLFVATYGDFDTDGDVDLVDYTTFWVCFNGPNRPTPDVEFRCDLADYDQDTDVDISDYATFSFCYNGPQAPPAEICYSF